MITPRQSYSWLRSFVVAPHCKPQIILLATIAYVGLIAAAAAQNGHVKPYALIYGTVWGPDNRPVYGMKVKIRPADKKKAKWELYSDHSGEFAQRVPAGAADYIVWADVQSFKSQEGKRLQAGDEVKVHVDHDERVDIGLHLK